MGFSGVEEDELWWRWRAGDSARLIARVLECAPSSVQRHLGRTGGVRPPARRRAEAHLSALEREEVSRAIAAGLSGRAIAAALGRSLSTISREIRRNGGRSTHRAATAEVAAIERARRPTPTRLASDPALLAVVRANPGGGRERGAAQQLVVGDARTIPKRAQRSVGVCADKA